MAEVQVVDQQNNVVGSRELNDAVFGLERNDGLVHRVYCALAQAQRSGTHSTKTRAEVSGGGKKPWKQKGTGRARAGSTRATQFRHGGVAHGPSPKEYDTRVNRKERQLAMRLVLSDLHRCGKLVVLDKLELEAVKTKGFIAASEALNAQRGLYVLASDNQNVVLSARNVPNCEVVMDGQISLHNLMKHDRVVLTSDAVSKIEERLL
ncbi:MAG: 50S ribosomal protein L4 [Mariprofundales bacterium]|nr:50S ribosomal protein L4 [Mariprofundales bacterium]